MKYVAKRKPTSASVLTVCLYGMGVGLFVLPSYLSVPYGAVLQLIGIVLLAFAVQYTIRYMLTDYTYEIRERDQKAVLNIYRTQGERSTLIACAEFDVMKAIEKKAKIEDGVSVAANYCPEFRPRNVYCIWWMDGSKKKAIYLQCDTAFASAIQHQIENQRSFDQEDFA